MTVPEHSEWPTPKSSLLSDLVIAIRGRSKSLNNRVSKFDIDVQAETHNGTEYERLNLYMENWGDNPDCLAFAFWNDGTVWLDGRRWSKAGWDYGYSFHGFFGELTADEVHDMIERSLWITDEAKMISTWQPCNLVSTS